MSVEERLQRIEEELSRILDCMLVLQRLAIKWDALSTPPPDEVLTGKVTGVDDRD